jgi:Uma2 family endonuclease
MSTTLTSPGLITAEQFQQMDLDVPAELVQGEVLYLYGEDGMTRPGARHGKLCLRIGAALEHWASQSAVFEAIGNDTGVILARDPDTVRGPDVLVIRQEKLPDQKVPTGWLTVPPDLCVEVLSPDDQWTQVLEKTTEYLTFGVTEVWLIDPEDQAVHVYRSDMAPRIVQGDASLVSESVLPGFSIPVSQLFAGL